MAHPSCYTSHGRISELIIFDYETFDLPPGEPDENKYRRVIEAYRPFVEILNEEREAPVKVYVFFEVMAPFTAGIWTNDEKLFLVPVNCIVQSATVPTSWTQDVMRLVEKKGMVYHQLDKKRVSEKLLEVMRIVFPDCNWELRHFRGMSGGNFMQLRMKDQDIFLECTNRRLLRVGKAHINRMLQIGNPGGKYFFVNWENPITRDCKSLISRVTFHVDQCLTPVGKTDKVKEFIFLVPDLMRAELEPIKEMWRPECENLIEAHFRALPAKLHSVMEGWISTETIPLFLINSDTEAVYGLCYNNCLVENYVDANQRRVIRIYFPDFREQASAFIRSQLKTEADGFAPRLITCLKNIHYSITNEKLAFHPQTGNEIIALSDTVIAQTHEFIKDKLAKRGIARENIRFLPMKLRESAMRLGGLHCRVKVIKRDGQI